MFRNRMKEFDPLICHQAFNYQFNIDVQKNIDKVIDAMLKVNKICRILITKYLKVK
jgi:hypothetical protein